MSREVIIVRSTIYEFCDNYSLNNSFKGGYKDEKNRPLLMTIISLLLLSLISAPSCGNLEVKNEIEQFDKEYNEIFNNEFWSEHDALVSKILSVQNPLQGQRYVTEMIQLINKAQKELASLYVPEPLEDYYSKKMESIYLFQKINNAYLNYYKNGYWNQEADEWQEEFNHLQLEIGRVKREVYRKYDLEHLLKDRE